MTSKLKDTSLPDVWTCEDTIFNICMNEIEEFPQYLTKFDDIVKKFPKKHLSEAYKNLEVDFVRIRSNGNLVTIEHHSQITIPLLRRDFNYLTTLHVASGKIIQPFIFNTGRIPKYTVDYASPTSIYNPIWINTQEIEASVKLNNIKYKISKQEPLNVFDVCDLIWMPKFRNNKQIEDIIVELAKISNNIIIEETLYRIFYKCLIMWAGKFVKNKEKIKEISEELNMSAMETEELFNKVMKTVRIEGELYRSHEKGMDEGLKLGKEIGLEEGKEIGLEAGLEAGWNNAERKFITKLLETHSPEEISQEYDVPLERVIQIQNDNE